MGTVFIKPPGGHMKTRWKNLGHGMLFIGYSMIVGSFIAFAALNGGSRVQDTQFFYWQRYFVDNVVSMAMIPGMSLFLSATVLLYRCQEKIKWLVLTVLSLLTVINSLCFITLVAHEASAIAFQSVDLQEVSKSFTELKGLEDKLGAMNGILLLTYLALFFFWLPEEQPK